MDDAKEFLKSKKFLWNSGIFLFKASTILNELRKYEPEFLEISEECLKEKMFDMDFIRIKEDIFRKFTNIPIDKAIMEKTKVGTVLKLNSDWIDIGSWESVWKNSKKDPNGNVVNGNSIIKNSTNCQLRSENRLIVGIGLKNITVIETMDAVLVIDNEISQKVKDIVDELKKIIFLKAILIPNV